MPGRGGRRPHHVRSLEQYATTRTAMKIEPPADDLGLQHLKATDRAKGKVEQVDHVEPYARIAPSEEPHEHPAEVPHQHAGGDQTPTPEQPLQPRRGERRGGGERRRQHEPTVLDTRSPHERRTEVRRQEDRDAARAHPAPGGIDELA